MTDKEKIIIDTVDVSECEYVCNTAFGNIGCKLPFNEEIHCCNIPNCYYKQLQRKEQECEELKAQLNDMACMDDDNVLCYPRQELKKECEKYEQALEKIQKIIKIRIEEKYYENCRYFKNCNNPCAIGIHEELTTILDIISKAKEQ